MNFSVEWFFIVVFPMDRDTRDVNRMLTLDMDMNGNIIEVLDIRWYE